MQICMKKNCALAGISFQVVELQMQNTKYDEIYHQGKITNNKKKRKLWKISGNINTQNVEKKITTYSTAKEQTSTQKRKNHPM